MPLTRCVKDGKAGWKYGGGACFVGPDAKRQAIKQGLAIQYNGGPNKTEAELDAMAADAVPDFEARHDDMERSMMDREAYAALSEEARKKVASDDFAGPHNTFPIRDQEDVEHAAMLLHHAADPSAVKSRMMAIIRRKGLKPPATWSHPS